MMARQKVKSELASPFYFVNISAMEALKLKLQQCAGKDAEVLSVDGRVCDGRVVKTVRCREKGSTQVHEIIVKEETEEKAAERRAADRKCAAKRRANATPLEVAAERARKTEHKRKSRMKRSPEKILKDQRKDRVRKAMKRALIRKKEGQNTSAAPVQESCPPLE